MVRFLGLSLFLVFVVMMPEVLWSNDPNPTGQVEDTSFHDQTISGKFLVEQPTLISLGFQWYIQGDQNRNANVTVQYRKKSTEIWKEFIPLLRIGHEKAGTPEWNFVTDNMFAGSIFDLEPNTQYECKLTLDDPDGVQGENSQSFVIATRAEPQPYHAGRVRHVYPKDWEGQRMEPSYNGLLDAYFGYPRYADWTLTTEPVQAGDIIEIHAGLYKADYTNYRDFHGLTFDGTYFLTQSGTADKPIVIKASGDGEVIFDGNGTAVLFDLTAGNYNYFEGITLQNAEVAIRAGLMNAYGANGLTVKNCSFLNVGIGIQGQYEGSRNYYIADNIFIGRESHDMVFHNVLENGQNVQRLNSYYAVKVHGQGHVICHNQVKYFFDGIDISTHARPEPDPNKRASAIDIYNNDIFNCNDNFIEADGGNHNIRILRNRNFNSGQQALSNQPVLGGPVYWVRNLVYNCGNASTFKFWGMYPSGIIAFHNTSTGILTRDDKPGSNVHMHNNLFLPSDDADLPSLGLHTNTSYSSLDYNGYRPRKQFIGYYAPSSAELYNFSNKPAALHYSSLKEFYAATGQEKHGIEVDYDIFENVTPPLFREFHEKHIHLGGAYPVFYPGDFDFRLREGAAAVDAGVWLPGINDDYTGKAPDLGALECGQQLPHYGPRDTPGNSLDTQEFTQSHNNLTDTEKQAGWRLLFDGVSTQGWHGYNLDSVTPNWTVVAGELTASGASGDIVTQDQFDDFELSLEYKISEGGNSGVFFHAKEYEHFQQVWQTGIEMQVMDNKGNPMGKDSLRNASSLYFLYPSLKDNTRPAGEWNHARIIVKQRVVEYWLNGELVNQYSLWTDKWYTDRDNSIHNRTRKPLWGEFRHGHIALQDEGFAVAYRNIKIREIPDSTFLWLPTGWCPPIPRY